MCQPNHLAGARPPVTSWSCDPYSLLLDVRMPSSPLGSRDVLPVLEGRYEGPMYQGIDGVRTQPAWPNHTERSGKHCGEKGGKKERKQWTAWVIIATRWTEPIYSTHALLVGDVTTPYHSVIYMHYSPTLPSGQVGWLLPLTTFNPVKLHSIYECCMGHNSMSPYYLRLCTISWSQGKYTYK